MDDQPLKALRTRLLDLVADAGGRREDRRGIIGQLATRGTLIVRAVGWALEVAAGTGPDELAAVEFEPLADALDIFPGDRAPDSELNARL